MVLIIVALCSIVSSSPASAQDEEQTAQVRALFEEALDHADDGRWEEAADRFRRAYEIRSAPVIGYNLAAAVVHLDRLVEASEVLTRVLRNPATNSRTEQQARALLELIRPRIGQLTVRLSGTPDGATVLLDGRPLATALVGVALPIDPGHHAVAVSRGESVIETASIDIVDGESEAISFEVPPPLPSPSEAAVAIAVEDPTGDGQGTEPPRRLTRQWWFWTALVAGILTVGAVAAGVGVALTSDDIEPISGSFGAVVVP